jgi:hypothetical protein
MEEKSTPIQPKPKLKKKAKKERRNKLPIKLRADGKALAEVEQGVHRLKFQKSNLQLKTAEGRNMTRLAQRQLHNFAASYMPTTTPIAVQELAQSLSTPRESVPVRYRGQGVCKATAVANPHWEPPAKWGTPAANAALESTDNMLFVFRNPMRAYIMYNPQGGLGTYLASFDGALTVNMSLTLQPEPMPISYMEYGSGEKHHGNVWFGASTGSEWGKFWWIDSASGLTGNTVEVRLGAANTWSLIVYRWQDGKIFEYGVDNVITNTTANVVIEDSGYYTWKIRSDSTDDQAVSIASCSISTGETSSVWEHRCVPDLDTFANVMSSIRINGLSAQYTNAAQLTNLGGTIYGMQSPADRTWDYWVANLTELTAQQETANMPANNGIYGFAKPLDTNDFDPIPVSLADKFGSNFTYPLVNKSEYLLIYFRAPNANQAGTWKMCWMMEMITTSPWWAKKVSTASYRSFEEALHVLSQVPAWHENPLHLADIWSGIKNGIKKAFGVAQTAMPLLAPMVSAL